VVRAREGDLTAWSRLYQESFDPVYRQLCYLTGDTSLAEDFAQEAFARAFSAIAEFDERGTFVGWVRGIGLNLVRMHWRRSKASHRIHDHLQRMTEVTATGRDPDVDRIHQQEQRLHMLYAVLETLPERLREAFVLRELQGLPPDAVAEQLGISVGNVAVRTSRARERIRKELRRRGWLDGGAE